MEEINETIASLDQQAENALKMSRLLKKLRDELLTEKKKSNLLEKRVLTLSLELEEAKDKIEQLNEKLSEAHNELESTIELASTSKSSQHIDSVADCIDNSTPAHLVIPKINQQSVTTTTPVTPPTVKAPELEPEKRGRGVGRPRSKSRPKAKKTPASKPEIFVQVPDDEIRTVIWTGPDQVGWKGKRTEKNPFDQTGRKKDAFNIYRREISEVFGKPEDHVFRQKGYKKKKLGALLTGYKTRSKEIGMGNNMPDVIDDDNLNSLLEIIANTHENTKASDTTTLQKLSDMSYIAINKNWIHKVPCLVSEDESQDDESQYEDAVEDDDEQSE